MELLTEKEIEQIFFCEENFEIPNNYYNCSLRQIRRIKDDRIKSEFLRSYEQALKELRKDPIYSYILNKLSSIENYSVYQLCEKLRFESEEMISSNIFPGDAVILYPYTRELRASKDINCDISSAIIRKGSYYIEYKPMFYNLSNGITYLLQRSIKCEIGYEYYLPITLHEFEEWKIKIENSYFMDSSNQNIDFYNLSSNIGDVISLKTLNKTKKN